MEIHPLEAELFCGDRHNGAQSPHRPFFFCNFAKAPQDQQHKNGHMSSTDIKKTAP